MNFKVLEKEFNLIKNRINYPVKGSYTSKLTEEKTLRKINEEAYELITSKNKKDIISETADLIYFILVLLAKNKIELQDILKEIKNRQRNIFKE